MVSKSQIKLIRSLAQKKSRTKHGLFVVEGIKGISEFSGSKYHLISLFTTMPIFEVPEGKTTLISEDELKKISGLTSPQTAVAIFKIPQEASPVLTNLTVALDKIRDPGNLGTIIRLCDWFGIDNIICSLDTVDCYNPKVVQASMGSLTRVKVSYVNLEEFLQSEKGQPVFGTFLHGENLYQTALPENGFIVLGNEANGISEEIEKLITKKLNIPQFGKTADTESLNVATATAIILSEFRRQNNY